MAHDNAYGQWGLAVAMIAISLFFLAKYVPIRTRMEKRSGGALATFLVALFAEMYGFPLTIYSLSHFVGIKVPLDHISGHLLGDLISWSGLGNGWLIVMILSNLVLIAGIWLISASWQRVYDAQGELVTDGPYRYMRHPQYTGIFIITLGFLVQWPTLPTLVLWPFVIMMYVSLARREESDVLLKFPDAYAIYKSTTPMFIPRLNSLLDSNKS